MTRPIVMKLGGSVLSQLAPAWWEDAATLARSARLILVHGWSRQLRDWQAGRNITPVFLTSQNGHRSRLTDESVIADIRAVAARLRELAAGELAGRGVPVRAVEAAQAGLLTAEVIPQRWWSGGQLRPLANLVGPVVAVDTALIGMLLPGPGALIVTPLATSASHPVVNVDGDRAAAAIAAATGAAALILVTDVPGVLAGQDRAVLPELRVADLGARGRGSPGRDSPGRGGLGSVGLGGGGPGGGGAGSGGLGGQVTGGMRKKVAAAARAAGDGIPLVAIGSAPASVLLAGQAGTRVTA